MEESTPLCSVLKCVTLNVLLPSKHFKDEDAQSPPVNCSAMAFALDDFRSQVLGSSTQSPGSSQTHQARGNKVHSEESG